jgi:uncharacterized membrane protein YkoI
VQVAVCTRKNAKARSRVAGALGIKTKNIKDRVDSANGPIEREMRMYMPRDSSNEDADLINMTVKLRLNYISSSQQTDQTLSPSAASPRRSASIKLSHGPSISQAPVEVLDDAQEAAATQEAAEQEEEQQQQQQQQHSPQPATPSSPLKRESPAKQEAPAAAGSEPQLPNAATPADESDTCGQEETKGGGFVKALLSVVATAIAGGVTAYFASSARESTEQSSDEQAKHREQQPGKKGRAWRL